MYLRDYLTVHEPVPFYVMKKSILVKNYLRMKNREGLNLLKMYF